MGRRKAEITKEDITKEILLGLLKTGAILALAVTAPGALKIFKDFDKEESWKEYYPSSIEKITRRLYRHGIVEIKYVKGKPVVKISEKGRVEFLKYDLDKLEVKPQTNWDGKWRLVIFDISEKYKKVRDVIRNKLKEIGFYPFQESVFVYPYPCEKEIQYLREILNVPHSLKLIRADRIENDRELRTIFKLGRKQLGNIF